MILELRKAKTAELEAELALYREGGVEDVAKELKNNAERIAEIERLEEKEGYAVRIDAEFLAAHPILVDQAGKEAEPLKEGEIVFFSKEELSADDKTTYTVTQEHFDTNPFFAEFAAKAGVKVGDEVQYDPAVVISREEAIARGVDVDAVEAEFKGKNEPKDEPKDEPKVDEEEAEEPKEDINVELVYQRKTVTNVQDVVAGGRQYKDISVSSGETFRLTPAEFDQDVKPRE